MEEKETYVINLYGSPGTGKSTTAAYLFALMKNAKMSVELVTEFAKDLTWESRHKTLTNQIYIFGKQHNRMHRLQGKVDFIITDCPLVLSDYYSRKYQDGSELFSALIQEEVNKYHNINIFLNRVKDYDPNGRNQTEEESDAMSIEIKDLLTKLGMKFYVYDADPNLPHMLLETINFLPTNS